MFDKEFNKFNKAVEDTIYEFFKLTPEQAKETQESLKQWYSNRYDLDVITFKNIPPEHRDILCKYKTLKYFNTILDKLNELKKALKGDDNDC